MSLSYQGRKILQFISCILPQEVIGTIGHYFGRVTPLNEEGNLVLDPKNIMDASKRKLRKRVIREYLVKWRNLPIEDATWEG